MHSEHKITQGARKHADNLEQLAYRIWSYDTYICSIVDELVYFACIALCVCVCVCGQILQVLSEEISGRSIK